MKVKKGYKRNKNVMRNMEKAIEEKAAQDAAGAMDKESTAVKKWEVQRKGKFIVRDGKKYLVYNNSGSEKYITFNISKISELWYRFRTALGFETTILQLRKACIPHKDPADMKYYIINFMICGKIMIFYIKQRKFDLEKIVDFVAADCQNAGAPKENFSIFVTGFNQVSRRVARKMETMSKRSTIVGRFVEPDMSLIVKKPADKELN